MLRNFRTKSLSIKCFQNKVGIYSLKKMDEEEKLKRMNEEKLEERGEQKRGTKTRHPAAKTAWDKGSDHPTRSMSYSILLLPTSHAPFSFPSFFLFPFLPPLLPLFMRYYNILRSDLTFSFITCPLTVYSRIMNHVLINC